MYHYDYLTSGTCAQLISIDLEDDIIKKVVFTGGCDGNLKAIPLLVHGMTVDQVEKTLTGVTCGRKTTSCADQLAKAVRRAYEAELAGEVQDFGDDD